MPFPGHVPANAIWLEQVFESKAASSGGIVRRSRSDVERKIGLERLELEVRKRGFRLIDAGDQLIVVCSRAPVRILV